MITKAFIYKQQDYKETSKLLFVYTPYGKFSLVAKGVKNYKNPYFYLSDYFNLIEVDINTGKSIQTLKGATLLNNYETLKKDYQAFKYASYITHLIDDLIVDVDINERLFELILLLLDYKSLSTAYLTFLIKITYVLGIDLTFKEDYQSFSLKDGTTLTENGDLNKVLTTYLKLLYYTKEEVTLEENIFEQLFKFIKRYYLYHLDYKIKDL